MRGSQEGMALGRGGDANLRLLRVATKTENVPPFGGGRIDLWVLDLIPNAQQLESQNILIPFLNRS